jgi:hypothetical protein
MTISCYLANSEAFVNIDDLQFGEQLIQLSAEPKVDQELRSVFLGVRWPNTDALIRHASASALADSELVDETMDWIEEVLRPEWMAPDLRSRLVAASGVVNGRDAFLVRYAIDKTKIQIIVTRFSIHLVISPGWASMQVEALACANALLIVQSDPEILWAGGPWSILPVDEFVFGYQRGIPIREWRDSLDYLSNGRAVKFSIQKIRQQSPDSKPGKTGHGPTEQAESMWFHGRVEALGHIDEFASDY